MLKILFFLLMSSFSYSQENQINESKDITISSNTISQYYQLEQILENIKKSINENKPDENKEKEINLIINETSYKIYKILKNYEIMASTFNYKDSIIAIRQAIQSYFKKNNRNPKNIEELIPEYLITIPLINIHGEFNNRIKYIRNTHFDKNYISAIDDKTEYVYFADPQSIYWGLVLINSNKKSEEEIYYYSY